ncbi:MAG TPA: diacylglycerol kinase family protein, partial [Chitinophagaceae bacterium]|nr:diacylglycerol kinase family protein [Chitinophagaceae bacterium]
MRNLLYIVNPISGTSNKRSLKEVIAAQTLAAGIHFDMYPSVANGDYSFLDEIIKEKKYTDIVIAGGDGTVNSAINALRKHNLPFGILPSGSGNGLAFSAGIPKSALSALNIVFKGKSAWTDAFLINNQFACMLCGLGFDAQVAHDFSRGTKRGLMS